MSITPDPAAELVRDLLRAACGGVAGMEGLVLLSTPLREDVLALALIVLTEVSPILSSSRGASISRLCS